MGDYIGERALSVKKQIEKDLENIDKQELESFFEGFRNDKRNYSFINYYNKTVLDKTRIKFSEFSYQWALHLPREFYMGFDKNYDTRINEIKLKKEIKSFHDRFCIDNRGKRHGSFCSKLFHTFLPDEFPPVDNPIRKHFGLQNEEFITAVLIIKKGYEMFIEENSKPIRLIKGVLSKDNFSYLRANELSDIRILDMYYWLSKSRGEKLS